MSATLNTFLESCFPVVCQRSAASPCLSLSRSSTRYSQTRLFPTRICLSPRWKTRWLQYFAGPKNRFVCMRDKVSPLHNFNRRFSPDLHDVDDWTVVKPANSGERRLVMSAGHRFSASYVAAFPRLEDAMLLFPQLMRRIELAVTPRPGLAVEQSTKWPSRHCVLQF
jgi:hypothetical protein